MNSFKINIPFVLKFWSVLLVLQFPFISRSQNDSLVFQFQQKLQQDLLELEKLYCFTDTTFFSGKFQKAKTLDFKETIEKLNLKLFPQISESAKMHFNVLNSLPEQQKQNLIWLFAFYEPQLEKELAARKLPPELKYFAPAFSAMNPASSKNEGKAGIWQLFHFQAVWNGLKISDLVDERFNVTLSTRAFAELMQQNFTLFDKPEWAALAWIYGNAALKNALYFAGENQSLENVLKQLPETAIHFIGIYQATAAFLSENRFKPAMDYRVVNRIPDTVKIDHQMHFQQLQTVLHIPEKQLEFLNPQYKFNLVSVNGKAAKLALPTGKWDDFVLWQDSVYNAVDSALFAVTIQKIEYPPAPNRQYLGEPVKDLVIEGKTKIQYTLKTGDVLGIIAEKYDVNVGDLKYWNNISNERRIQAGKKLDIFIDNDRLDDFKDLEKQEKKETLAQEKIIQPFKPQATLPVLNETNAMPSVEHVVKSGESPFTIAKKYNNISPEEILQWNKITDARKIQVGQKLKIYLK